MLRGGLGRGSLYFCKRSSVVSALGMVLVIRGAIAIAIWPTLLGASVVYLSKLWFIDRMVWLYEDMKNVEPEYRSWLY